MLNISIAGRLGRDATYKQTQGGHDLCGFPVAVDVGFGENKQTYWVDVTRWGKGAERLADILRKGSAVAVCGELTTREHEGKTYLQCRADNVTIQGTPNSNQSGGNSGGGASDPNRFATDDLDDDIPF